MYTQPGLLAACHWKGATFNLCCITAQPGCAWCGQGGDPAALLAIPGVAQALLAHATAAGYPQLTPEQQQALEAGQGAGKALPAPHMQTAQRLSCCF